MANESMGIQPAGGVQTPAAAGFVPVLDADEPELGYEAADPLLQERLWGDAPVSWRSMEQRP